MAAQKPGDCWIVDLKGSIPDIGHETEIRNAFDEFADSHFSSDTSLRVMTVARRMSSLHDVTLDEQQLQEFVTEQSSPQLMNSYNLIFINRFLVKTRAIPPPLDAARLRVSKAAFECLVHLFSVPSAFVFALARYYLPSGRGYITMPSSTDVGACSFWYILPIRMQVRCTDSRLRHTESTGGSNQMNPFHYLHLPDHSVDIRSSQIALNFRYDENLQTTAMLAINFIDGRWPKTTEEPQLRIKEVFDDPAHATVVDDAFFLHLIYLTSVLRWWTNALNSINMQLITYESTLQDEVNQESSSENHGNLNKALHAMAAHLHRYSSELASIEETVLDIFNRHKPLNSRKAFERVQDGLAQILSQVKSVRNFEAELEKKIQNILALLFNRIQLANDRILVANGVAMQEIMQATQEETRIARGMAIRAHRLTEDMKKDSLSMKTVAVLTMFFLPGTSFAALLSMPFFSGNAWLGDVSRLWIWVVLTVPSTGLAFTFYVYYKRLDATRQRKTVPLDDTIELGEVVSGQHSTTVQHPT